MFKASRPALLRALAGVALLTAVGLPLLAPTPAQAWWRGGWWHPGVSFGIRIGGPIFVGPPVYGPPVYYGAPYYAPPYYARPYPGAYWVRPHYNQFGYFVPGHWVR
ncbi:MAG TPA: hypothetical protein VMU82_18980 [Acetobacteraceae bacterium]|nr:hypothetical protein [Acetobacteraceae bacterium]